MSAPQHVVIVTHEGPSPDDWMARCSCGWNSAMLPEGAADDEGATHMGVAVGVRKPGVMTRSPLEDLRFMRAALVRCVKALRCVLEMKVTHDEGCHPSEGVHTALCRKRKRVLEEVRTIVEGGLYEVDVRARKRAVQS